MGLSSTLSSTWADLSTGSPLHIGFRTQAKHACKSLKRIRDFINELVELKNPNEKDFVVNANTVDYIMIKYTSSFVSSEECDKLKIEL